MKLTTACCTETSVSEIKFEEGASKAVILNPDRKTFTKVRIDGCLIKQERAADGALYDAEDRVIVIELKGNDVAYGAKQILSAARFLAKSDRRPSRYGGIVVGKEYPRISSTIQRSQSEFAKAFRGPLHVVTKNGSFSFEAVLSFKGPHKI